jgi:hypothetical protein
MIPDHKILKKKCKKKKIYVKKDTYFQLAEEFIMLESIFNTDDIIDSVMMIVDMIFYPIYVIIQLVRLHPSPFYIFGLMKAYQLWIDWLRYKELSYQIDTWIFTVKKLRGPWISTNNPTYHVYVYADAMERLSLVTN